MQSSYRKSGACLGVMIVGFCLLSILSTVLLTESAKGNVLSNRSTNDSALTVAAELGPAIQMTGTETETMETTLFPIIAKDGIALDAEWTAQWWQWVEPLNNAPILDVGPSDCGLGQSGDIWFLAGTEGGPPVERSCPVPADKMFVIPLFTAAWDNEGTENLTVAEKRAVLDGLFSDTVPGVFNSKICQLSATVDGVPYSYARLASPTFPRRADPEAVADGYWFAVRPEIGDHVVQFTGALCDFDTGAPLLKVDVTYQLTVEPANSSPTEPWQLFVWVTADSETATGCTPTDPTGVIPCDATMLGRNSVYAEAPPWTFETVSGDATLTVVDTADAGDEFEVYDDGVLLGRTTPSQEGAYCYVPSGGDPGLCLRRPGMSTGVFPLEVGSHAITIKPVEGFGFGYGYFRIDDPVE